MDNKTSYAVIGIVAALALFGIVVLTVAVTVVPLQQAEAAGCPFDTQLSTHQRDDASANRRE